MRRVRKSRKTVLVTGGAHRVGRAIAVQLARQGYDVAIHFYRSRTRAREAVSFIKGFGVRSEAFECDLSKTGKARQLTRRVWERFGPIDLLVNSAAIFFQTPVGSVRESDWNRLLDVNLKGPFFLSQEFGVRMRRRGKGQIVNVLDVGAFRAWAEYLPYCISKAGAAMLTRGLAKALAPRIRVNAVIPGPVLLPPGSGASQQKASARASLLKRLGRPEDVARTVGFLADGPDYMTGTLIAVDGGKLTI